MTAVLVLVSCVSYAIGYVVGAMSRRRWTLVVCPPGASCSDRGDTA